METKKIVGKRKTQEIPHEMLENPTKFLHQQQDDEVVDNGELNLSLSSPQPQPKPRRASTPRSRSSTEGGRAIIKTDPITPPFQWATNRRATVHSMEYLVSQGINTITGNVQCKKCDEKFEMELNVVEKFRELVAFIINEGDMRHRAPEKWMESTNLKGKCGNCGVGDNCKPLIEEKKRNINWLFLVLGQVLGCCTLEQLRWFCKYTNNHRTGAKDRVVFLCYFTLCKQLDPNGRFDI
ncbi:hypothetical protein RND81_09G175900 [Saponaria officinalis]|uniref:DUF7086 domain-containing protein n=1 Tax=Saponaria officinalis TaxID=3572 RepID=A0AAW1IM34_SAPOF